MSLPDFFLLLCHPVLDTGICKGDIRVKPEYDREEFEDDRRKNNTVIVGLDPAIKERDVRLKAEHDVEKRLNMTSCSQLDRNTGCGMNLC